MPLYLGTNQVAPTKISDNKYGWIGPDAQYVGKLYEWSGTLNDTTYSTFAASSTPTSSQTILTSASSVANFTIPDRTQEAYYVLTRWGMNFVYNSGATMIATPVSYSFAGIYDYYNYPNNTEMLNGLSTFSSYTSATLYTMNCLQYYNTSGTLTWNQVGYGPAYCNSSASWSTSISGNRVTVNLNRPAVSARCSASYFATDRISEINTAQSTIKCRLDLFKGPIQYEEIQRKYRLLTDIHNNNWNF